MFYYSMLEVRSENENDEVEFHVSLSEVVKKLHFALCYQTGRKTL